MRSGIAFVIVSLLGASEVKADNQDISKSMLINGSAIIGQAIACDVAKDRLLAVMTVHASTIEVLSGHDPKVMKMRDDIIKLATENERKQVPQRCSTIQSAFAIFENSLKEKGLLKK